MRSKLARIKFVPSADSGAWEALLSVMSVMRTERKARQWGHFVFLVKVKLTVQTMKTYEGMHLDSS